MVRGSLAALLVALVVVSSLRADTEAEIIKKLRERVDLLESKLDLAKKEADVARKELDSIRKEIDKIKGFAVKTPEKAILARGVAWELLKATRNKDGGVEVHLFGTATKEDAMIHVRGYEVVDDTGNQTEGEVNQTRAFRDGIKTKLPLVLRSLPKDAKSLSFTLKGEFGVKIFTLRNIPIE